MRKNILSACLVLLVLISGLVPGHERLVSAEPSAAGGILYESQPDEVALYLSDIAFVRDTITLSGAQDVRILLPPGTFPDTLILTENGERVRNYRLTAQSGDVYASSLNYASFASSGTAYSLTWEPQSTTESREIRLEYLLPGASWKPTYDMQVIDDETVRLAFFAEVRNTTLVLDDATVYLVAGRVDLSEQLDQVPTVTMNQYMVGYADEAVELPALGVGSIDLQHIYPLGDLSALPGDTVYVNLVDASLSARRLVVWDAGTQQETDVIYKVKNDTEVPFAEGVVRIFQDGLFMGSDFIETTPLGSEGSVTVGSLPDVRVRRSASEEYRGDAGKDYYQHAVTLEVSTFGEEALDLMILDRWEEAAWQFEFSLEPDRKPDNILEWNVSIPAGESLTITYEYRTEY
jgi:hypothetical protein